MSYKWPPSLSQLLIHTQEEGVPWHSHATVKSDHAAWIAFNSVFQPSQWQSGPFSLTQRQQLSAERIVQIIIRMQFQKIQQTKTKTT